jgi:AN1-type zinc finger and ubiquitin domain-containing protein 1
MHEVRAMSGMLNTLVSNQSQTGYLSSAGTSTIVTAVSTAQSLSDNPVHLPIAEQTNSACNKLRKLSAGRSRSRVGSAATAFRIPSVKMALGKKSSQRCSFCGKRMRLAMCFQCRCGNNFCSTHRYAETHSCTFDYKAEGRKLLEQNNPVIAAPKLPKM